MPQRLEYTQSNFDLGVEINFSAPIGSYYNFLEVVGDDPRTWTFFFNC